MEWNFILNYISRGRGAVFKVGELKGTFAFCAVGKPLKRYLLHFEGHFKKKNIKTSHSF